MSTLTPYHQQNPTPNAASDLPLETVFSRQAENVVIFSWVFGPRTRTRARTRTERERYIYLFNII